MIHTQLSRKFMLAPKPERKHISKCVAWGAPKDFYFMPVGGESFRNSFLSYDRKFHPDSLTQRGSCKKVIVFGFCFVCCAPARTTTQSYFSRQLLFLCMLRRCIFECFRNENTFCRAESQCHHHNYDIVRTQRTV